MTPANKIKHELINRYSKHNKINEEEVGKEIVEIFKSADLNTDDGVDEAYDILVEIRAHWDLESEFREGQCETNIKTPYNRNYETKSVASKLSDGSWVGWTYWYGGGKHGNPEEIPWIDDAYDLICQEEEKSVIIRTFTKLDE